MDRKNKFESCTFLIWSEITLEDTSLNSCKKYRSIVHQLLPVWRILSIPTPKLFENALVATLPYITP
jgi:hypothetical protein